MFLPSLKITNVAKGLLLLTAVALYLISVASVSAQSTIVELTVNGGSTASITNGQDVDLSWYIQGSVSGCSINNGVGAIDISGLPSAVTGSLTVTPPSSETVNYVLTCTGGSSSVTVSLDPIVTLSLSKNPVDYDIFAEEAEELTVEWDSQYATDCSAMWLETASNPGTQIWTKTTNGAAYDNPFQTSGSVLFSDDSWNQQPDLVEDVTFYVTCENVTTGAETTGSVDLTVNDPQPLPPPTVDLFTEDGETVAERNEDLLWATVPSHLHFDAQYTDTCSFSAFYLDDGTEYAELPGDLDRYGNPTDKSYGEFYYIQIWEDTRFRVDCIQSSYTLGGVTYPEATTFAELDITIDTPLPPDAITAGLDQVTADLSVTNPPSEINPATNLSQATVVLSVRNADDCDLTAIQNGSSVVIDGWNFARISGSHDNNEVVYLEAGTTTLEAVCYRDYETTFYTPADSEYYYGVASTSIDVFVPNDVLVLPDPVAYIYTGAIDHGAEYINDNLIAEEGFEYKTGSSLRFEAGEPYGKFDSATMTFPFSPVGGSDGPYDIHVEYCDTNDGFHDFELTTSGGFTTTWRSDSQVSPNNWCGDSQTRVTKRVGTNVALVAGETFTITCNNGADTVQQEECLIGGVYFGPTDNNQTIAQLATSTGFVNTNVFWSSEYTDACRDDDAETAGGVIYEFADGLDSMSHIRNLDIATTTTFNIECYRTSGESENVSTELIILGAPGDEVIEVETLVASGQCLDALGGGGTSVHDIHGTVTDGLDDDLARSLGSGERAGVDGTCEASIDLAADDEPAFSTTFASYDPITGFWDDVSARVRILNLGDGAFEGGIPDIPFTTYINFGPTYQAAFGVPATLNHPDIDTYDDPIAAPAIPNDIDQATASDYREQVYDGSPTEIPFGEHVLCMRVNLDGTLYPESDSTGFVNNEACRTVSLGMQQPPMSIDVDRTLIRSGDSVNVSWTAHTQFPMTCTVSGPGISTTFQSNASYPSAVANSQNSGALESKSEYTLTCTENITSNNYSFTVAAEVEIVPAAEEI